MKNNKLKGRIINAATGKGAAGLKIEVWSTIPLVDVSLTSAVSKKNGNFELSFAQHLIHEVLRRQSTIYFKIYFNDELLTGLHQRKIWEVSLLPDNIEFMVAYGEGKAGSTPINTATADGYTVQGTVFDTLGNPAPGVMVKVYDKDMRGEQHLGDCTTDEGGKYLVRYNLVSFNQTEYASADLSVKAYNDAGTLLYQPSVNDILFNAPQNAIININLNINPRPLPSEFENYQAALQPLTGDVTFDKLEENTLNQDITFLSKETGLNYTYLEYFALAFKAAAGFDISPALVYAILRENTLQGADLSQWYSIRTIITIDTDITGLVYDIALLSTDQVTAAVEDAIKNNIIPDISGQLSGAEAKLKKLQKTARDYAQNERPQQWLDIVADAITSGRYAKLVDVLSKNYYGNLPALLKGILDANPFTSEKVKKTVTVNFHMGALLGTDLDLIKHVKKTAGIKNEKDIHKLAALHIDDWKKILAKIPDATVKHRVAPNAKSAEINASILFNRFTSQYPHAAFVAHFEKDDKHAFQNKTNMLKVLAAAPGADLGKQAIDTQLKHLTVDEKTKSELRKMQRLYKLVPQYDKAKILHADNIHSSYHIASLGEKQFVKKYTSNNTFTPAEAKKIYQKASVVHTATLMLSGELRDFAASGNIKMLDGDIVSAKIEQVAKDFPNLKSLFKEIDYCECQDCRSVYGPAAYMVDVLQFLESRLLTSGTKSAKDVLFARRPDLGNIDLNCDNAMTPLPYIDLVCEILEEAVSPDPGLSLDSTYTAYMVIGAVKTPLRNYLFSHGFKVTANAVMYPSYLDDGITTFMLRDKKATIKISADGSGWIARELKQTHLSPAELNACPEYVNQAAYDTLQISNISFNLPFDLYQQEGGSLLETVGVDRAELMRIFQVPASLTAPEIAAVALGIPPAEASLITTIDTANQDVYWNTAAATIISTLQEVDVFLLKSELTYSQLNDLLSVSFINPTGNIYIKHQDSTCNTAKKIIQNLDLDALDRMHRFLRLWRRAGGTMINLNQLISYANLGNQLLNADTLALLYALKNLQNSIGITVEQSLSFYGLMPADKDASLYQSVFVNRIVLNPADPAFNIQNIFINEGLTAPAQDILANHITSLMQCLKMTAAEVQFLIDKLKVVPADTPPLTRDNLAFLYRNHILAKTLGIKLPDMYAISSLSGQGLFTSPDATIAFIDTVRFIQSSGFTLADLQWFLQNIDPGTLALTDSAITAFLKSLQKDLQSAYDNNISPFDATANSGANQNGLKQLMGNLPAIDVAAQNKITAIINGQYNDPVVTAQAYVQNLLTPYFDTTDAQGKITTLLAATPANLEAARNNLIQSLDTGISAYLYIQAKETVLYSAVQNTFGASDVITQVILQNAVLKNPPPGAGVDHGLKTLLTADLFVDKVNNPLQPPAIALPAFDAQFRAVKLLGMLTRYFAKINITASDLSWFLKNNKSMGWLELDNLVYQSDVPSVPFSKWYKFQQALQLMNGYGTVQNPNVPAATLSWIDVWDKLASGVSQAGMFSTMALFTGWDAAALNDIDTYFAYTYPGLGVMPSTTSYGDPATYLQIAKATASLRLLSMALSDMKLIIKPVLGKNEVLLITNALRNKYDENQWLNIVQPVQTALRPQKRDALVAYLLAVNTGLQGADDLYDYFLVDVEMQAAQQSSRIVLAHGTLQLFIQRCLMALEPTATADVANDNGWEQWAWMENFQVWVANRKIFLYPENWFYPELRAGKSYFFADLVSDLQQNQVNDDNVEKAAIAYLEKLDDVANLDVRACYYDTTGGAYTFHVFARIKGGSTYYYRTCVKERTWSAWEKVNVDISGDHLLTFIRNNRLFLAWPLFAEDTKQTQSNTIPNSGDSQTAPDKRYKIQLAVSEYANGTWQPKRVSQDCLYTKYYTSISSPGVKDLASLRDTFRMLNFDLGLAGDDIVCTFDNINIGAFSLSGCKGYPEPVTWNSESLPRFITLPVFANTDFVQMQYREITAGDTVAFAAATIFEMSSMNVIFNSTPSTFKITYPHEFSLIDWVHIGLQLLNLSGPKGVPSSQRLLVLPMASYMPFFYADNDREYVVIPGYFEGKNSEKTFTDIHRFFSDVIAFLEKYIQKLINDPAHDLNKLLKEMFADETYQSLAEQVEFYAENQPQFMFRNFYHPLVCYIKSSVYNNGLKSIMSYDFQSKQTSFSFDDTYHPDPSVANQNFPTAPKNYPVEDIDFSAEGSSSLYNWELFYHLPYFIANQLSQNQQFEEAMKWYHYIFNPTGGQGGAAPQKYWVTKPFHEFLSTDYAAQRIDTILNDMAADPLGNLTGNLVTAVNNWRAKPFMPDVVAQTRPVAYQKAILISYINNLIAWGDQLFTQNTTESKVQATGCYIMADKLLGPMPLTVPPAVPVPDETYNQLSAHIDTFGNAMIDLENLVPNVNVLPQHGNELPSASLSLLYFCVPANSNLLSLWSTIADRLYKIRNCEDINGNPSFTPLFAPPIDPGMLVRAAAAGLDISSILSMLNAPLPIYRFKTMVFKAIEMTQNVSNLGNALLAALEKKDAEMLSQLRSVQEISLQNQVLHIKQRQIDEADQSIVELNKVMAISQAKYNYYTSRDFMNAWEIAQAVTAGIAIISEVIAIVMDATSGAANLVPTITGGAAGFGGSPLVTVAYGGENIGESTKSFGSMFRGIAGALQSASGLIGNIGSYQRRMDEWTFQGQLANLEMNQITQQIVVAGIRKDIAVKEANTQQTRIDQAVAVDTAIKSKYTNKDLYSWMTGQISGVYYQSYQLALSLAQKAEQCYQYELARQSNFISPGYWDTMHKGLLAGDTLMKDIKRLESSYLDFNKREYEMVKFVSVSSLDPRALLQLQNSGKCDIQIPETLFDMDYPGHYLRRIKSVSITIPCVAGPLTTVGCTLTLVNNKYRKSNLLLPAGSDTYAEVSGGDDRFIYNIGFVQSIATSSGQNDSGLFELNFADERYLPFEGMGAISTWHLEMNDPAVFAQFDYQSISDVIIQLKYTARSGGGLFKTAASASLTTTLKTIADSVPAAGLFKIFDLKHDCPNIWHTFMTDGTGNLNLSMSKVNFPYYAQSNKVKLVIKNAALFVQTTAGTAISVQFSGAASAVSLIKDTAKFGADIQFIDPIAGFTADLKLVTDTAVISAQFQSFPAIKNLITHAWIILNYDLTA